MTRLCTCAFEYKFTGKERDTESGNDYFGARYYASSMGRFMSPDWSAKEEPVPYATMDDPQSLNLYSYVKNNPLSHVDADGHCCDLDDIGRTLGGAINAIHDNNFGPSGAPLPENGLGRSIGNAISLVQGLGQIVGGSAMVAGGGTEAIVTSPTVVLAIPGAATAVAGAAIAADGVAVAGSAIHAMGDGSYTNTHASGMTYDGKGDTARAQQSGARVEKETGDKHVSTDHTTAADTRESFKDESRRLDSHGGAGSDQNHNKIESPGKKYRQQDGSK